MKRATRVEPKREHRRNDFPELQVGFPERNDAANPIDEMERIHVDLETLSISRKNTKEFTREITSQDSANDKV
jgi:hypothetical protein